MAGPSGDRAASLPDLVAGASVLLLAVKPQIMGAVLDECPHRAPDSLVISIAAAFHQFIQERPARTPPSFASAERPTRGSRRRRYRRPPMQRRTNLPGARDFRLHGHRRAGHESALDAITALSDSEPACFFYLVECLVEAAVCRASIARWPSPRGANAGPVKLSGTGEPRRPPQEGHVARRHHRAA